MLRKDIDLIRDTSSKTFFDDLAGVELGIVDFWAPWCGPCKRMSEIIESLAKDQAFKEILNRVKIAFFKVNVDEEASLAQKFQVMSLPFVLGFFGISPIDRFSGRTKEELLRWILRLAERVGEKHGENSLN